jgi:predicted PurR-regulated permease PerM
MAFWLGLAAVVVVVLWWLEMVLLLVFLALIVGILLDAMAEVAIRHLKIRRSLAVVLAAFVFLLAIASVVTLLAVPMAQQASNFVKSIPETVAQLTQKVETYRKTHPSIGRFLPALTSRNEAATQPQTAAIAKKAIVTASTALEAGANALATFFLALFLAWNPERWNRGIAMLWPDGNLAQRIALFSKLGAALRSYLISLAVAIVMMGVFWTLGLWIVGIPYPLFFGVIGGVVEVVPYVGPLIGLIPPLVVSMTMGWMEVIYVLVVYAVLHIIEGYILVPLVMHQREHLPPPLVVLSILVFGSLFGILGVILAVPLGTIGYVLIVELVYKKREANQDKAAD